MRKNWPNFKKHPRRAAQGNFTPKPSQILIWVYETHILAELRKSAMLKKADTLKKIWDIIMKPET
jgi:hypothetical protein